MEKCESEHKRNEEGDQGGFKPSSWTPLEGPKIYFRRSQNLPDYSVIRQNTETSFSQYKHFIYPSNQVAQIIMINVKGVKKNVEFL